MSYVAREWEASISVQATEVLNTVPVDIVVTHPAISSRVSFKPHVELAEMTTDMA